MYHHQMFTIQNNSFILQMETENTRHLHICFTLCLNKYFLTTRQISSSQRVVILFSEGNMLTHLLYTSSFLSIKFMNLSIFFQRQCSFRNEIA